MTRNPAPSPESALPEAAGLSDAARPLSQAELEACAEWLHGELVLLALALKHGVPASRLEDLPDEPALEDEPVLAPVLEASGLAREARHG